jgi:Na+-driven multidrug efflux pump
MGIVNNQLRIYGGDLGISMMGVIIGVMMMVFMFAMGVSQGAQPIIGYNYGALKYDRVKKTMGLAILVVISVVFVAYLYIMFFPANIVRMFNKDDEDLIKLGVNAMPIFFSLLPLIAFQAVSSTFFQALGKAKQAIFLVLSRTLLFHVPGILILPRFYGLDGVWLTTPVSVLGSSLVTGVFLFFIFRQLSDRLPVQSSVRSSTK